MGCGSSSQPIEKEESYSQPKSSENIAQEIKEQYEFALDDFMNGTSYGALSVEKCKLLMNYNKNIREYIYNSLSEKIDAISINPYGKDIIFVNNPAYVGPESQEMYIETKEHKMSVYFDRD